MGKKKHVIDSSPLRETESSSTSAATKEKEGRRSMIPWQLIIVFIACAFMFILKAGEDSYYDMQISSRMVDVNPYEALSIPKSASKNEIRKAYRTLSLKWHPDRKGKDECDENCKQKFKEITDAYRLLMNDERRTMFDQTFRVAKGSSKSFYDSLEPWEFLMTPNLWKHVITPSLKGKQSWSNPQDTGIWAVLVTDPKHSSTETMSQWWNELSEKFYGQMSFVRVDSTAPEVMKYIPMKLKIFPAIMVLSPSKPPQLYDHLLQANIKDLAKFLIQNVPYKFSVFENTDSLDLFKRFLSGGANKPKIGFISERGMPPIYRALSEKTAAMVDWVIYDLPRKSEYWAKLSDNDKTIGGVIISGHGTSMKVPTSIWKLSRLDLKQAKSENDKPAAHDHIVAAQKFVHDVLRSSVAPIYDETWNILCKDRHPTKADSKVLCAMGDINDDDIEGSAVLQRLAFENEGLNSKSSALASLNPENGILIDTEKGLYKQTGGKWKKLPSAFSHSWSFISPYQHIAPYYKLSLIRRIRVLWHAYTLTSVRFGFFTSYKTVQHTLFMALTIGLLFTAVKQRKPGMSTRVW